MFNLSNLFRRPGLAATVSILWVLLVCWIAFGWDLGSIGLIDETEPLFAEASRQMLVTGDWITPYFNNETRFDKPALIYWCQAIAYVIVGVNEWGVRLPSALAALGIISLVFYTIQWHLARKDQLELISYPLRSYLTATIAASIMAFTPEMIVWGRTGVSDMLLTGCMGSALLCFFLGYANPKQAQQTSFLPNKWYLACYVLIAGAILTKGPVGIVLPGLIIAAFVFYLGNLREVWQEMRLLVGISIIFLLSAPWYILITWRNRWNFINAFFGYHNLERFTAVVNGHAAPWYFYFLVVLLGFAPYSLYIPAAMAQVKFWQRSYWIHQERSQQLGLFACFWFLGVFGFFTVAVTKLPSYVLPLMPASAILVALAWSNLFPLPVPAESSTSLQPQILNWTKVTSWVNLTFLTIISLGLFNLTKLTGSDPAAPDLYQIIDNTGSPTQGGVIWFIAAIIIAICTLMHRWRLILMVNLLGFLAFLIIVLLPTTFVMDKERQLPLRELSAIAVQTKYPQEELVMLGFKKPSVTFYTHEHVNYLKYPQDVLQHMQKLKAPSLLLLAEQKKFIEMDLAPDDYKSVASRGAYHLVRIPLKKQKAQRIS